MGLSRFFSPDQEEGGGAIPSPSSTQTIWDPIGDPTNFYFFYHQYMAKRDVPAGAQVILAWRLTWEEP